MVKFYTNNEYLEDRKIFHILMKLISKIV